MRIIAQSRKRNQQILSAERKPMPSMHFTAIADWKLCLLFVESRRRFFLLFPRCGYANLIYTRSKARGLVWERGKGEGKRAREREWKLFHSIRPSILSETPFCARPQNKRLNHIGSFALSNAKSWLDLSRITWLFWYLDFINKNGTDLRQRSRGEDTMKRSNVKETANYTRNKTVTISNGDWGAHGAIKAASRNEWCVVSFEQ